MVKTGGLTNIGKVRKVNEDCFYVSENFALVSDGMGGHNKGEVASGLLVKALSESLKGNITKDEVIKAVSDANSIVINRSKESPDFEGMGATLVFACWNDYDVLIGNVGDSRCYHITHSDIVQVTKDHSLVQRMIDNGQLTEEEAKNSDKKHIIYRAMGTNEDETPDVFELKVNKNDVLLLCSDGLSNMIENREIMEIVKNENDPDVISEKLVKKANEKGGTDNITVVAVMFN